MCHMAHWHSNAPVSGTTPRQSLVVFNQRELYNHLFRDGKSIYFYQLQLSHCPFIPLVFARDHPSLLLKCKFCFVNNILLFHLLFYSFYIRIYAFLIIQHIAMARHRSPRSRYSRPGRGGYHNSSPGVFALPLSRL